MTEWNPYLMEAEENSHHSFRRTLRLCLYGAHVRYVKQLDFSRADGSAEARSLWVNPATLLKWPQRTDSTKQRDGDAQQELGRSHP